jgi:hypothetical protein
MKLLVMPLVKIVSIALISPAMRGLFIDSSFFHDIVTTTDLGQSNNILTTKNL